jgi:hypothetical protein
MTKKSLLATVVAATLIAAGCGFERKSVIGPSGTNNNNNNSGNNGNPSGGTGSGGGGPMVGVWTSQNVSIPNISSCGNFQWAIANQTATTIDGTFSADCADVLTISGSASGQLTSSTTVAVTVNGSATLPGLPPCNFSLNGTGTIEDNESTLRIPYTGTTCFGPVHGTEVLRKHSSAPPDATPGPTPPPTVPPGTSNPNHVGPGPLTADRARAVINATANEFPNLTSPRNTTDEGVAAAQELLRRMIWHLQLAGFQAGRQRNPSGALSNDKLTIFIDGAWHAYDVFNDLGAPGVPMKVQFFEVAPANYVPDPGIPD